MAEGVEGRAKRPWLASLRRRFARGAILECRERPRIVSAANLISRFPSRTAATASRRTSHRSRSSGSCWVLFCCSTLLESAQHAGARSCAAAERCHRHGPASPRRVHRAPAEARHDSGAQDAHLDAASRGSAWSGHRSRLAQGAFAHSPTSSRNADLVSQNNHAVTKMYWLEPGALSQTERNVVYLCRPEVRWMRIIAGEFLLPPPPSLS